MTAPNLYLSTTAANPLTADTVAASNIQTRIITAFNSMLTAWQAAKQSFYGASTDPQGIADALDTYASDWFTLFGQLQTLMNEYLQPALQLPSFVSGQSVVYTVTPHTDGTVTITPNIPDSGQ
jgi:hypothetical protein